MEEAEYNDAVVVGSVDESIFRRSFIWFNFNELRVTYCCRTICITLKYTANAGILYRLHLKTIIVISDRVSMRNDKYTELIYLRITQRSDHLLIRWTA